MPDRVPGCSSGVARFVLERHERLIGDALEGRAPAIRSAPSSGVDYRLSPGLPASGSDGSGSTPVMATTDRFRAAHPRQSDRRDWSRPRATVYAAVTWVAYHRCR